MADKTGISWTDSTWPVVTGCTHISEGCDNCYAARLTGGRLAHHPAYSGLAENGKFNGTVRLLPDRLDWPLHWRKPRRIFVSDMADLFHQDVPDGFIAQVFAVMASAPQHTFQVLTKRHARMRSLLSREDFWLDVFMIAENDYAGSAREWPLPNVWLGVSVENQHWADIRIPSLLDTPAAVRFLSCEPLLGLIDLYPYLWLTGASTAGPFYDHAGRRRGGAGIGGQMMTAIPARDLHWAIAGGESGPGHRPMDLAWLAAITIQCQDAGVPVWVKQDSGPRAGQQGRIPDDLFIQQLPEPPTAVAS